MATQGCQGIDAGIEQYFQLIKRMHIPKSRCSHSKMSTPNISYVGDKK